VITKPLAYPPPWQDTMTLAQHICVSPSTIDNWVAAGILPPPRKRGGKLMWRWSEVDARLAEGDNSSLMSEATGIRDAVRREREADRAAGY
jgi:predicted DNA-binding transcriptional regulator AlpA